MARYLEHFVLGIVVRDDDNFSFLNWHWFLVSLVDWKLDCCDIRRR